MAIREALLPGWLAGHIATLPGLAEKTIELRLSLLLCAIICAITTVTAWGQQPSRPEFEVCRHSAVGPFAELTVTAGLMAITARRSGELDPGSPIVLFQPSAGLVDYDVAADRRFLVNLGKAGFNATRLNVVMDWEAGLK